MEFKSKIKTRYSSYLTRNFQLQEVKIALLNYLFAKKNYGTFIFRMNDVFGEEKKLVKHMADSLKWLNIEHESAFLKENEAKYQQKIIELIKAGGAYPDQYCNEHKGSNRHIHPGHSLDIYFSKKDKYSIRLKLPDCKVSFKDPVFGKLSWELKGIRDPVILSDKRPSSFFMDVIEDGENEITHVIQSIARKNDIPLTIVLMDMLGYDIPIFSHVPNLEMEYIVNDSRNTNLSKLRKNLYTSNYLEYYQDLGFIPNAIIEILTNNKKYKLCEFFEINKKYLKELTFNDHLNRCREFTKQANLDVEYCLPGILASSLDKLEVHSDILNYVENKPEVGDILNDLESSEELKLLSYLLEDIAPWTHKEIKEFMNRRYSITTKIENVLKIVLCEGGANYSSIYDTMFSLGRNESIRKIKEALKSTSVAKEEVCVNRQRGRFWYNSISLLHRVDGPAIDYFDGNKEWFLNGKRHRSDGPAIEYTNGSKEWFIDGKCHREDGPAVIQPNGTKNWFLNGVEYSFERFTEKLEHVLSL